MIEAKWRYRKFNRYLRETFGEKVFRVGLLGGFTCPNRDGTIGSGGCTFCNPKSTEPFDFVAGESIEKQLIRGMNYTRSRHGAKKFMAYFQDYTTTYGNVTELEALYRAAISQPEVVGLALTTRPDSLPRQVLKLLARMAKETFVWVELGVQSANDKSLATINRCHDVKLSQEAISALHECGVTVSAHVIIGLPGESIDEERETAAFVRENGVEAVKIHNLHVLRDTPLAKQYEDGQFTPMTLPEYVDRVISFLEELPASVVIQRLAGDAPHRFTLAPKWAMNKMAVLNEIERQLKERDSWQGKALA